MCLSLSLSLCWVGLSFQRLKKHKPRTYCLVEETEETDNYICHQCASTSVEWGETREVAARYRGGGAESPSGEAGSEVGLE